MNRFKTVSAGGRGVCICCVALLCSTLPARAADPFDLWEQIKQLPADYDGARRWVEPNQYGLYRLDVPAWQNLLALAPPETSPTAWKDAPTIHLPMPDGRFEAFRLVNSPVLEPPLAAQHPDIQTYIVQGVDTPAAIGRLDFTPLGFHALVSAPGRRVFIDPALYANTGYYVVYDAAHAPQKDYRCSPPLPAPDEGGQAPTGQRISGNTLRIYRAAIAATGEYTQYYGGTVANALAGITTTLNRVNLVYERDLTLRMVLVAGNTTIIYTDPATDPFGSNPFNDVQAVIDGQIGSANYDIGHVFSVGSGGVAQLGSVCVNGSKARGYTALNPPQGDAFDIDYVAHEIGHQFRANHSFNGTAGSCSGNRNASTAWEPGSGSTIMAYAGICGSQNLQTASDDYMHYGSIAEMNTHLNGTGACSQNQPTGNAEPVVNAGPSYVIPISTPFALTAIATDADSNDTLTYCWEQLNAGAPLFRSYAPTTSPTRFFPRLQTILANGPNTLAETLPSTARTMTFVCTVRDNRAGGGGVDADSMTVTVEANAGPFLVTSPNTAVTWNGLTQQTVTWNVANTQLAPISSTSVSIMLSIDGGLSFPVTILAATPNDGSETITVPNIATTQARIKIQPVDNIYFDLSDANFTIIEVPESPALSMGQPVLDDPNLDGVLNPLECVLLHIDLSNVGVGTATGVEATLTSSTPGVSVVQPGGIYPAVAASGPPQSPIRPFRISTDAGLQCGTPAEFVLTVTSDNAPTIAVPFNLPVGQFVGGINTYDFSSDAVVPIPDGVGTLQNPSPGAPADSPVAVTGLFGVITNVTLSAHLTHTYMRDLVISLIAPDQTTIRLTNRHGGSRDNMGSSCTNRIFLTDAATSSVTNTNPPWTGQRRPFEPLSTFNGLTTASINGNWVFRAQDFVAVDTGSIRCWTLTLTVDSGANICPPGAGPCPPFSADVDASGQVNAADLAILLSDLGSLGPAVPGDVNQNGRCDQADLLYMLARIGQ